MQVIEIIEIDKSINEAVISVKFSNTPEDEADVIVSYELGEDTNATNIGVEVVYFNENKGNYFAIKNHVLNSSRVIDLINEKY